MPRADRWRGCLSRPVDDGGDGSARNRNQTTFARPPCTRGGHFLTGYSRARVEARRSGGGTIPAGKTGRERQVRPASLLQGNADRWNVIKAIASGQVIIIAARCCCCSRGAARWQARQQHDTHRHRTCQRGTCRQACPQFITGGFSSLSRILLAAALWSRVRQQPASSLPAAALVPSRGRRRRRPGLHAKMPTKKCFISCEGHEGLRRIASHYEEMLRTAKNFASQYQAFLRRFHGASISFVLRSGSLRGLF